MALAWILCLGATLSDLNIPLLWCSWSVFLVKHKLTYLWESIKLPRCTATRSAGAARQAGALAAHRLRLLWRVKLSLLVLAFQSCEEPVGAFLSKTLIYTPGKEFLWAKIVLLSTESLIGRCPSEFALVLQSVGSSALAATTTAQILQRMGLPLLVEQPRRKVLLPHQLFVAVQQFQAREARSFAIRIVLFWSILIRSISFIFYRVQEFKWRWRIVRNWLVDLIIAIPVVLMGTLSVIEVSALRLIHLYIYFPLTILGNQVISTLLNYVVINELSSLS